MTAPNMTLPRWSERPPIPAAMLNPALLGVAIAVCANQYQASSGHAMPWTLAYLTGPLVMHEPTRQALPRTSATSLASWVQEHPVLVAGLPDRARMMTEHVREGIRFGLRERLMSVDGGRLSCDRLPKTSPRSAGDVHQIVLGAGMLGRVFARAVSPATIFATLRVRP